MASTRNNPLHALVETFCNRLSCLPSENFSCTVDVRACLGVVLTEAVCSLLSSSTRASAVSLSSLSQCLWESLQRVGWSELCTSLEHSKGPGQPAAAQHSSSTLAERVQDSTSVPEVLLLVFQLFMTCQAKQYAQEPSQFIPAGQKLLGAPPWPCLAAALGHLLPGVASGRLGLHAALMVQDLLLVRCLSCCAFCHDSHAHALVIIQH